MCLIGTHLVHVLHVVGRGDGVVPRAGDDQLAEGGNHGLEGPGHPGPAEALMPAIGWMATERVTHPSASLEAFQSKYLWSYGENMIDWGLRNFWQAENECLSYPMV